MSWTDKENGIFSITTGDGKVFYPLWNGPTKSVAYNISEFEYRGVSGTDVDRRKPKGARHNLDIIFQGDDNREQAAEFERSSADERPWQIKHPVWGNITVQPVELVFDADKINTTRITGTVVESNLVSAPGATESQVDIIINSKALTDETFAVNFENTVTPTAAQVSKMTQNVSKLNEASKKEIAVEFYEDFVNYYNEAQSAILSATTDPGTAIRKTQAFINYPPQLLSRPVINRLDTLIAQYESLVESIATAQNEADKIIIESQGGAIISAMAIAAASPLPADYAGRKEVLAAAELVIEAYNGYIEDLDGMQASDGSTPGNYIPSEEALRNLNGLINYTIANLFAIANGAKQSRTVTVEYDTNLILLAHRFYGLKADDSTIETMIKQNGFGLDHILEIKKGTKVEYYL